MKLHSSKLIMICNSAYSHAHPRHVFEPVKIKSFLNALGELTI